VCENTFGGNIYNFGKVSQRFQDESALMRKNGNSIGENAMRNLREERGRMFQTVYDPKAGTFTEVAIVVAPIPGFQREPKPRYAAVLACHHDKADDPAIERRDMLDHRPCIVRPP
jgi:hypothetical protein